MKVFIYNKSDSKKIKVIKNVNCIYQSDTTLFIKTNKRTLAYNTKKVKTTCYQN